MCWTLLAVALLAADGLADQSAKDASSLYETADQLVRANNLKGACDAYLKAIPADPARLGERYYDIANTFRRAKRMPDLGKTLLEIDLAPLKNAPYQIANIIGELAQQKDTQDTALGLLRRAWDVFPEQRTAILSSIYSDELWNTDEVFNKALEAIVPGKGALPDPWQGVGDVISYNGDGRVTGLLSRLIQATKKPERAEQLTRAVNAGLKITPEWRGGDAILAVLEAKAGNTASAEQRIEKLLKDSSLSGRAALVLGQEIGELKVLLPQAIRLLEASTKSNEGMIDQFSYHPGRYLARLYYQSGDRAKARQTILELLSSQDYSRYGTNNPGYAEYVELENYNAAGQDFLKMEMPLDAVRIYQRATADPAKFQAASRWGGNYLEQQLTRGQDAAQKALTPQALSAALGEWIRMREKATAGPIVDFGLAVQPSAVDTAAIVSLFETAVLSAAGQGRTPTPTVPSGGGSGSTRKLVVSVLTPVPPRQADTLQKLRGQLAAAAKQGDDLSLRIASALVELIDSPEANAAPVTNAVQRVTGFLAQLGAPAKGSKPTEPELAVWLVARRAIQHSSPEVQRLGRELCDWSLQTASRHSDRTWVLAMLREQGQAALGAGDKAAAERLWAQMLDEILRADADAKPTKNPL